MGGVGGRRIALTEGGASGAHGAKCFVSDLPLTPVGGMIFRACGAESQLADRGLPMPNSGSFCREVLGPGRTSLR